MTCLFQDALTRSDYTVTYHADGRAYQQPNPTCYYGMLVYISRLRKHLAHDPSLDILNSRGVGHKLIT